MTRLQEVQWLDVIEGEARRELTLGTKSLPSRVNLYRISWLRPLFESQWPQFLVRALILIGFIFTILTALLGSPVGSHNFAIIILWIAWWTILKLGFIPLGGRSWCSVCPIALPGDWLQQGGILYKSNHRLGLNLRWPSSWRGSWLQSAGFLLIGIFSALTLTDPRVTGWVLLALFMLAIGMSLIFENRAFCSYICPVGGFSGLYAKLAPVEVRVVDREICRNHRDKSCYKACPWGLYPVAFRDSSACGLCLECLRACPENNLALNLRPHGSDMTGQGHLSRLDETILALIMLGSALAFSAVFLGPWGWLKSAAFAIGSRAWLAYTASFLLLNLLIFPGLFFLAMWIVKQLSRNTLPLKKVIANQAHGLLPLGLFAWIAFTISFALPKLGLITGVLSDPFAWGWNLLHITRTVAYFNVSAFSPYLQLASLAVGIFWSVRLTREQSASESARDILNNLPLYVFYFLYSGVLLWLLLG